MRPGRLIIGVTVCLRSQVFGVGELEGGGGRDRCDLGPLNSTNLCVSHTGRCWRSARKEQPLCPPHTEGMGGELSFSRTLGLSLPLI